MNVMFENKIQIEIVQIWQPFMVETAKHTKLLYKSKSAKVSKIR